MIDYIVSDVSPYLNPYLNQTVESVFLDAVGEEEIRLFFWTNAKCVFVGRNQNAFAEVDVAALEKDGGKLCRRVSGGGAVFHDEGNLNFTIICSESNFDKAAFSKTLVKAFCGLGVRATLSGRNDIEADGAKFSGNAYYTKTCEGGARHSFQHGTVLISSDCAEVAKYLTPNAEKLDKRGVKSVSARVTTLNCLVDGITKEKVIGAIIAAFVEDYPDAEFIEDRIDPDEDWSEYAETLSNFESAEWKYYAKKGNKHADLSVQTRVGGGGATLEIDFSGSYIKDVHCFTDSLDNEEVQRVEDELVGLDVEDFDPETDMIDDNLLRVLLDVKREYEHKM